MAAANKANLSPGEIRDLFYKKVILFTNQSEVFSSKTFNEFKIWRVRKNVRDVEDLTNPKTFSYPPAGLENGRCHLKEQPVFYGSINRATALFEAKPDIGDILYVSDWESRCERDIKVRFLLPENIAESNRLHPFSQKQSKAISEMSVLYGQNKAAQLEMIARFIGNYFIEEEFPYYLTSWLGNQILFDQNNLDLFYYASAKNKTGSLNLAIKPAFVDSSLKVLRVYKIKVKSIVGTVIELSVLGCAENVNGKLVWRMPEPFDADYLQ